MARLARTALILALLPVAACSSMGMSNSAATTPPPAPAAPPALPAADMSFMTMAANGGEIELGKLARDKTHRIGIRKFADQMVTDHTLIGQELAQIASQKGIPLTPTLDPADADVLQQLQGESGMKFDADYIRGQVAAHQKTIALFQQEADSGSDPDLKRFAMQTLPKLKQHLKMAMTEEATENRLMRRHH